MASVDSGLSAICDRPPGAAWVPALALALALLCREPRLGRWGELLSPFPGYTPEYREFSVCEEAAEGSEEETDCRPSLEGADMFCEGCYLRRRGGRMARGADMRCRARNRDGSTTRREQEHVFGQDAEGACE